MIDEEIEYLKQYRPDDFDRPSVTVDIVVFTIIKNKLNVLVYNREQLPYKNYNALPGGFVKIKESLEETVGRILRDKVNLTSVPVEQLYTFGRVNRDPRMRIISVVYYALIPYEKLKDKNLIFQDVSALSDLAFDHNEIINYAVERLQSKIKYSDIAFNLLSDKNKFTIYEVQKIYEAVLQTTLGTANFRRDFITKYVKTNKVEILEEKSNEFSKRASCTYKLI